MITLATLTGDCELSEGCLRIRALLSFYPGLRSAEVFAPIEDLHAAIHHLDVGDARRDLSAEELARQDRERHAIEGRHRSAVLAAMGTSCDGCPEDVDGSGFVDECDAAMVIDSQGECPFPDGGDPKDPGV